MLKRISHVSQNISKYYCLTSKMKYQPISKASYVKDQ